MANNGIKSNDQLKKWIKSNACKEDAESADFAYPLILLTLYKDSKTEHRKALQYVNITSAARLLLKAWTATKMDGTIHTDFWKSKTSREVKSS